MNRTLNDSALLDADMLDVDAVFIPALHDARGDDDGSIRSDALSSFSLSTDND